MAMRYTAYCKKSAADVTPAQLLAGTTDADLMTIAEYDDVPDALVESALGQLRMDRVEGDGFHFYRLSYRPEGVRQIDVERWQTIEEVREVVAEVLEDLEAREEPLLHKLRPHLDATVDIVDASFGSSPDEVMAPVLASEVTRWLAERFDGIIRAADDSWWELGSVGEYVRMRL